MMKRFMTIMIIFMAVAVLGIFDARAKGCFKSTSGRLLRHCEAGNPTNVRLSLTDQYSNGLGSFTVQFGRKYVINPLNLSFF